MPPKDIVVRMVDIFKPKEVNWSQQIRIANKLLEKYTEEQIIYAMKYYQAQSVNMYSLGWLSYKDNMKAPLSMLQAEKNRIGDGFEERNNIKLRQLRKTECREDYPLSLFAECADVSGS